MRPQFDPWDRKFPWRKDRLPTPVFLGVPGVSDGKESACNEGDLGLIPRSGRSPGGVHGNPLQYSCLENPHGQGSLAGYSPWAHKELDMTERISFELFNNSIYIITLKRHSVQFSCSFASDSVTPWTVAHQASLSITNCQSLLKVMSIKLVMPSNHLILCCPLLLLPSEDIHFSSLTQSCLTLCNPMNHSMPGLPVHYQLLEFIQTHIH